MDIQGCPVLITGATGLLGGELARQLAKSEGAVVECLIRGREDRLRQRMHRSNEEEAPWFSNLIPVIGDVTKPLWGLGKKDLDRIRTETRILLHAAADTSFLHQEGCREVNIEGMKQLITLARSLREPPFVVYISTACNAGELKHRCLKEEEGCLPDNTHINEYTHSKAIAEELLRRSELPHLILRPSIVMAAGLSDRAFARQILWIGPMLNEFDALPIDPEAHLDVVPISYVVDATIELMKKDHRAFNIYHLSSGTFASDTMGRILEYISAYYRRKIPIQAISPEEWKDTRWRYVSTPFQRKVFFSMRYYLPFLSMDLTFDNRRLSNEFDLRRLGLMRVTEYLSHLLDIISFDDALSESHNP